MSFSQKRCLASQIAKATDVSIKPKEFICTQFLPFYCNIMNIHQYKSHCKLKSTFEYTVFYHLHKADTTYHEMYTPGCSRFIYFTPRKLYITTFKRREKETYSVEPFKEYIQTEPLWSRKGSDPSS